MPSRIMIVDRSPLVLEGLAAIVDRRPDLKLCSRASTVEEALELLQERKPQLVIADYDLPDGDGSVLVQRMAEIEVCASIPVVFLSSHVDTERARCMIATGVCGVVTKEDSPETVLCAIDHALRGDMYVSGNVLRHVLPSIGADHAPIMGKVHSNLSKRELEVFSLFGYGYAAREVSERLHISVRTVETYRQRIKTRLGLANTSELNRIAISWVHGTNLS